MKKITLVVTVFSFILNNLAYSQEKNNLAIGLNLNQYQNDFGMGIHILSPYFAGNSIAIKIGANIQWLEHLSTNEMTWSPYYNFQVGFKVKQNIFDNKLFSYAEGGTTLILPNQDFSNKKSIWGGYGLIGLEFSWSQRFATFIELGGIGTGAIADKILSKPTYSNGFMTSTGLRYSL